MGLIIPARPFESGSRNHFEISMGKSAYKKSKKARLKQEAALRAEKERKKLFPFVVTVKQGCGCCESTMRFKSEASFLEKWQALSLTCMGEITDDTGERFTSLDTFYGYVEGDENGRSLEYLVGQLTRGKY